MIFSANVLTRWSFQKNFPWNMIFLVSSGKMIFLFPENVILFFRRKMKNHLSPKKKKKKKKKNTWTYNIFCIFGKGCISFFYIYMILHFFQKSKDDFLPKNTLKDDISGIIERDDINPGEYDIFSSNRKN